jgi:hypothetical protein
MGESIKRQISTLSEREPTQYGLLQSYHADVHQAIEGCSRNYPSTAQIRDELENPTITPQMLGNLLSVLTDLSVIGIQSQRNNSNRYDLTQYDPGKMQTLARLLQPTADQ